jgi:hypothetical protein
MLTLQSQAAANMQHSTGSTAMGQYIEMMYSFNTASIRGLTAGEGATICASPSSSCNIKQQQTHNATHPAVLLGSANQR